MFIRYSSAVYRFPSSGFTVMDSKNKYFNLPDEKINLARQICLYHDLKPPTLPVEAEVGRRWLDKHTQLRNSNIRLSSRNDMITRTTTVLRKAANRIIMVIKVFTLNRNKTMSATIKPLVKHRMSTTAPNGNTFFQINIYSYNLKVKNNKF